MYVYTLLCIIFYVYMYGPLSEINSSLFIYVCFSGKSNPDPSDPDYVPSLTMGYSSGSGLTPDGKKSRFSRLTNRTCKKDEVVKEKEQQSEAASILMDLSVSSLPSEPVVDTHESQPCTGSAVDLEANDIQDAGSNTGKLLCIH